MLDVLVSLKSRFVKKDIPRTAQIVVELDPYISTSMLREGDIAISVYILGIVQLELHHRRDRVLEPIRPDEVPRLSDLLYRQEGSIDVATVLRFVLLLDKLQEPALSILHADALLLTDDTL